MASPASPPTSPYDSGDPSATLRVLLAEELELDFASFDLDSAWRLGSSLRSLALERDLGIAVAVALGEQRAFHAATPGSAALNDAWLERKFRVVRHYAHSSLAARYSYLADGQTFEAESALDPSCTPRPAAPSRSACAAPSSAPSA